MVDGSLRLLRPCSQPRVSRASHAGAMAEPNRTSYVDPKMAPSTGFEIAQLNVGRAVAPLEHAVMADFMNRLDESNALAERSPGFVWRLQGDNGNNTSLKVSDAPLFIVNLSVWSSIDALYDFTYRSDDRLVFKRRHEWFERLSPPNTVVWWQPAGTLPTAEEALARLDRLTTRGPTPEAFTFNERFPPPTASHGDLPSTRAADVLKAWAPRLTRRRCRTSRGRSVGRSRASRPPRSIKTRPARGHASGHALGTAGARSPR